MMNEVTITRVEYDHLKEDQAKLNLYQRALTKCARFSDWRHSAMVMDDEDFLEMVALFDYATYCDVKRHCERQKAEAEKEKAAATAQSDEPAIDEIKAVIESVAKEDEV